jgi:VIT1/CCC1 family predicted Fe2+/Mn2+ transporter
MGKHRAIDGKTRKVLIEFQRNEITERHVYRYLAGKARGENIEVLQRISEDEGRHYEVWRNYTQTEVSPSRLKILKYILLSRVFGLTFSVKLMEKGESHAQRAYEEIKEKFPEIENIAKEEEAHERKLIDMISEERLEYIGSMVLGLNDALVELTGALAGLTLALQNSRLIGMTGLITGIAASLSMMSSEYLSQKAEGQSKSPLRASFYTGVAYVIAVFILILPFFLLDNYYLSLTWAISDAILVILLFTYFVSVAKDLPFGRRFLEMALISLGVAAISFGIGYAVKLFLGVEV